MTDMRHKVTFTCTMLECRISHTIPSPIYRQPVIFSCIGCSHLLQVTYRDGMHYQVQHAFISERDRSLEHHELASVFKQIQTKNNWV